MKKMLILVFILSVFGTGNIYSQQWEKLNKGLYGGSIHMMAIKDSLIVAANRGKGICISTNYGTNWKIANNGLYLNVMSVAINDSMLFVGTQNGLYTSTNMGGEWKKDSTLSDEIWSIVTQDSNVFLGTYKTGIVVSTNYGLTWTIKNNGIKYKSTNCFALDGNKVYAGTNGGLYFSSDLGNNWKTISNENFWNDNQDYGVSSIAIKNTCIYIVIAGWTYLSKDNCETWKRFENVVGGEWIKTIGNDLYFKTYNNGIIKSIDEGQTWTSANGNLPNKQINDIVSQGGDLYLGIDYKGVYLSQDNGFSWSSLNNELTQMDLGNIINVEGNLYLGQSGVTSYISDDRGNTWSEINNGLSGEILGYGNNGSTLYALTTKGLNVSNDMGLTWEYLQIDKALGTIHGLTIQGDKIYLLTYGFNGSIQLSKDKGKTWKNISEHLPKTNVDLLFTCKDNLYIGCHWTNIGDEVGVFLSTDEGNRWKKILPDLISSSAIIDSVIFIAGSKGVKISTNYGESWYFGNNGAGNPKSNDLFVIKKNILVGTNKGVYLSEDYGYTWTELNFNLESLDVLSLTVCDGHLFAVTSEGRSVYRLDVSALSVTDKSTTANNLSQFSISPNPAGDFITITMKPSEGFEPSDGSAIQIFNTLGEIVLSDSARHAVPLRMNIESLPKGMYFVRIGGETAKFVKM